MPRDSSRPPLSDDSEWLTLQEAAGYLRVTPPTIYRYCEQGLLPVYELPTAGSGSAGRRFRREDLSKLLRPATPEDLRARRERAKNDARRAAEVMDDLRATRRPLTPPE